MKKYLKEIIILSLQGFMFYILPLFAGPTDAMGMVFLIWLSTIILGFCNVMFSNNKIKYLYPIAISLLFIPSVFIYYNSSALVHSLWYLISSSAGMLLAIIIKLMFVENVDVNERVGSDKNILIAFLLNLCFALIEVVGGIITNSIAIVSDAIHDVGDAISIGISYLLEKKSKNKPDENYTYGYVRYSVLGSLITSGILLSGSILVLFTALRRLMNPVPINYNGMIVLAIIGVIINFLAAYFTKEKDTLNQKSVNLHMIEDVLGWATVLAGAIVMRFTDLNVLDPLLSMGVAIFIIANVVNVFKDIIDLFLEKTPKGIDIYEIKDELLKIKGVEDVHHIHVRSIDGINNYATMHVVASGDYKKIKKEVKKELSHLGILHTTIELEDIKEKCLNKNCEIKESKHSCHHH